MSYETRLLLGDGLSQLSLSQLTDHFVLRGRYKFIEHKREIKSLKHNSYFSVFHEELLGEAW